MKNLTVKHTHTCNAAPAVPLWNNCWNTVHYTDTVFPERHTLHCWQKQQQPCAPWHTCNAALRRWSPEAAVPAWSTSGSNICAAPEYLTWGRGRNRPGCSLTYICFSHTHIIHSYRSRTNPSFTEKNKDGKHERATLNTEFYYLGEKKTMLAWLWEVEQHVDWNSEIGFMSSVCM